MRTPVSLLDVSQTIATQFDGQIDAAEGLRPLPELAAEPDDPDRIAFSEYHAIGAVSGGFMLRKGRWKLNYYVGFEPELFDLGADPEELVDLAADPNHAAVRSDLLAELWAIVDPTVANAQAFADQAALVARVGGKEAALKLGPKSATPPPKL